MRSCLRMRLPLSRTGNSRRNSLPSVFLLLDPCSTTAPWIRTVRSRGTFSPSIRPRLERASICHHPPSMQATTGIFPKTATACRILQRSPLFFLLSSLLLPSIPFICRVSATSRLCQKHTVNMTIATRPRSSTAPYYRTSNRRVLLVPALSPHHP